MGRWSRAITHDTHGANAMTPPDDAMIADASGAPALQEAVMPLANGGVFAGWRAIETGPDPFEVMLGHQLGRPVYTVQTWFWRPGAAPHFFAWSSKVPHPDEAGPVLVRTTANYLYLTFLGGRPLFAEYSIALRRFDFVTKGWVGALVIPG